MRKRRITKILRSQMRMKNSNRWVAQREGTEVMPLAAGAGPSKVKVFLITHLITRVLRKNIMKEGSRKIIVLPRKPSVKFCLSLKR
jgi:hypothetical protein